MQNDVNFRAKQFLPFDALTGFYDAIRKVEIMHEEKKEFLDVTCCYGFSCIFRY